MKEWSKEHMIAAMEQPCVTAIYVYTPLCGTCQLASQMITLTEKLLPDLQIGQCNLNYVPEMATKFAIESVPCLLVLKSGKLLNKIYAFHSVTYLYEILSKYSERS
ncbi:thioredoxin family protein [Bacillus chungangensis]|uniref:Thioredoxin-like negative regulator of GroEL n=1 Tax=Bacillus chungangensis TaxID=587633 RepID=A0ABT9WWZ0_9BACI|nr:thioredoxin family protein [Bacillus chungangensis]MDQ0177755.1 thioredoxin-like negative regulator of GroEL [Bacillus chungangensis]